MPKEIYYQRLFFFLLILLFLLGGAAFTKAADDGPCDQVINDPVSGTLSVSPTSAYVGDTITISISGQDDNDLYIFEVYYRGSWHYKRVSGISAARTWTITEEEPAVYRYCGRVTGYKPVSRYYKEREKANTSPYCIDVAVSCRPDSTTCVGSSPSSSACSNECSYQGQTRCYDSRYRQVCGNYDSDSCLEWSSLQLCSGSSNCGYGGCAENQRPNWYCSGGECQYNCYYSSTCQPACQCSAGPCCDGCNYKPSTAICNFENQNQYGCPWGTACGSDVGKSSRTRFQYCSGNSAQCLGSWGSWQNWGVWQVNDYCSASEVCSVGAAQCQYSSACSQPATYIKNYRKDCEEGVLYWFDSKGVRQEIYDDCSDDDECTLDECKDNACSNTLNCDGTTCSKDSEIYCRKCEHCGDGILNCGEDQSSCPNDFELKAEAAAGKGLKALLKKWYTWVLLILGLLIFFITLKKFRSAE